MKTRISIALAATAAMVAGSAVADEARQLTANAADLSLQMQTGAMASEIGSPPQAQPQTLARQLVEQYSMRSVGDDALAFAAPFDRPVIAPESMLGDGRQSLGSPADTQLTGSGFETVKAARHGRSETDQALSTMSGGSASLRDSYAPMK
jgi:hypothetical protein